MRNENRVLLLVVAGMAALVACDPTSPVQSSDVTTDVSQAIATHNANPNAHTNLIVDGSQITNGTLTGEKLGVGAVGATNIASGAITSEQISATAGIEGSQLANGAITALQIASATVTGSQIAPATITGNNIAAATITASNITAATITTTQISAAAGIMGTQLAAAANITGTQLAAAADIAGSQLAAAAGITGGQIANSTIQSANVALGAEGMGASTNIATFDAFYTVVATVSTTYTFTFACSSNDQKANIQITDATTMTVVAGPIVCSTMLANGAQSFHLSFPATATNKYELQFSTTNANQPVTWQSVSFTF